MTTDEAIFAAGQGTSLYFDDLSIGHLWISEGRTVTETDLVLFGTWSGDMHPLHSNEVAASRASFGARVFHGPGVLSLAFGLEMRLGWKLQSAIAFLSIKDWKMSAPIFIGDTIHVRETVTELRASKSQSDCGIATTRVEVLNQRDEICQSGEWVVLLKRTAG